LAIEEGERLGRDTQALRERAELYKKLLNLREGTAMSSIERRTQRLLADKRQQLELRVPRLRRPVAQKPPQPSAPFADRYVVLGSDNADLPVRLDERTCCEHMHVIGTRPPHWLRPISRINSRLLNEMSLWTGRP
jgi:hypothetical protein